MTKPGSWLEEIFYANYVEIMWNADFILNFTIRKETI